MELSFIKFSATGNDFIAIDNRKGIVDANDATLWRRLCARRSGIGADGVLLVEDSSECDFAMRYLNADGGEVEMCGNGARTIAYFASILGIPMSHGNGYFFETMKGRYSAFIDQRGPVTVAMSELYDVDALDLSDLARKHGASKSFYLNTGVPHAVFMVDNLEEYDVHSNGEAIRYEDRFEGGVNANFFTVESEGHISLRTYERGVEAETLACGTGATAAAITYTKIFGECDEVRVTMPGGELKISFGDSPADIKLSGAVEEIYRGTFNL